MSRICFIFTITLLLVSPAWSSAADDLTDLMNRVEALNIQRGAYTLGKALTGEQKERARGSVLKDSAPGTLKFRDGDLYIVTHEASGRIIVLYEHWEPADKETIQNLVGSLFLDFGDPTVFAHDKIIYWVYTDKGKLTEKAYKSVKEKKGALNVLAAVKLNSSMKIMGKEEEGGDTAPGSVYCIISSEPVLKLTGATGSSQKEASP
ncbi:MAG: hypothetical protein GY859_13920 [Desulfobacterales bacterium]|nr:hypothetical protein [Desulfobacterales bacterium]